MTVKINQKPVLESGSVVLRTGEQLQLITREGPITIKIGTTSTARNPRWDEGSRTFVLEGFDNPAGDVAGVEAPSGAWSLRVAVYTIGQPTAARVIHYTLM